jgi:sodium/pantothenate symporter
MNWAILVPFTVYIALNIIIGLYGRRVLAGTKAEDFVSEYYAGGRSLGGFVLAFTLTTSLVSAGTFIGTPALGYSEGFVWLLIGSGQITGGVLVLGVLGKKFAIVARKIDAYTVPRVLAVRFPHPVVGAGSALIMVLFLTFYMSAQFIGGSIIFETMAGVPYVVGLVLMVFTTIFYTGVGGYRAVVLTDTLQGLVMLVGVGALFWAILSYAGGMGELMNQLHAMDPTLLTPDAGGDYSWGTIITIGWVLVGIGLLGMPHVAVRGLTFRDSKAMHRAMVLVTVVMFFFTFVMMFLGTAANVVIGPGVEVADTVIPLTIIALFPPVIAGIILAAPFAAIMSTVSSMLLVSASGLVGDVWVDAMGKELSLSARARLDRRTTLALGGVVFVMALFPPPFLQSIVFYAIGGLASCFLVPLIFGLYWQRANRYGAIASIVLGTGGYVLVAIFFPRPLGLHDLTWSLAISVVAMVGGSLLTEKPSREVIEAFWGQGKTDKPPYSTVPK